ncbi:MAG: DUF3109 family protein [Flavobacteriales bacterium]
MCNLSAYKEACCIESDSGAPLEKDKLAVLETIRPKIKPYMLAEGVRL